MKKVAKENLLQLKRLLSKIQTSEYTQKPEILSGASIGEHMRHVVEFYLLLVSGSTEGVISYDKRVRDVRIENDPGFAINTIDKILLDIEAIGLGGRVKFDADYTIEGTSQNLIESSIDRELAYCIEHSIHHQAIIKAGLISLGLPELADEYFGVAYSTIRYRNDTCAQ